MGNCKIADLDFVGITEQYEESIRLFNTVFETNLTSFHKNKTKNAPVNYREYYKDQGKLAELETAMAENIAIYKAALARFSALQKAG